MNLSPFPVTRQRYYPSLCNTTIQLLTGNIFFPVSSFQLKGIARNDLSPPSLCGNGRQCNRQLILEALAHCCAKIALTRHFSWYGVVEYNCCFFFSALISIQSIDVVFLCCLLLLFCCRAICDRRQCPSEKDLDFSRVNVASSARVRNRNHSNRTQNEPVFISVITPE